MEIHQMIYPEDKKELYRLLTDQMKALTEGRTFYLSNLSNAAALLFNALRDLKLGGLLFDAQRRTRAGTVQGKRLASALP